MIDRRRNFQKIPCGNDGLVRFVVVRERLGLPTAKMMAITAVADFVEDGDGDVVAGTTDTVADGDLRFFHLQAGGRFAAKLATGFDDFYETGAAECVQVFQAAGNIRGDRAISLQRTLLDGFEGFSVREDTQVDEI